MKTCLRFIENSHIKTSEVLEEDDDTDDTDAVSSDLEVSFFFPLKSSVFSCDSTGMFSILDLNLAKSSFIMESTFTSSSSSTKVSVVLLPYK